MSDRIVYTTLCRIGTQLQHGVDRDVAETRRITYLLADAEDTHYSEIPYYREQLADIKGRLDRGRIELGRHAAHCTDGCKRAEGQFAGGRATGWARSPSHDRPELPSNTALVEMLREGQTIEAIAVRYGRHPNTIQQRLAVAGWSTRSQPVQEATPTPPTAPTPVVFLRRLLERDQPWKADGLCAQTDPEAFFPEKGGSVREAKAVCARCTVAAECLDYALEHSERHGIWGGLSERERRRIELPPIEVPPQVSA